MRSIQQTVTATRSVLIPADNINRNVYINIVGNQTIAVGGSTVTFANGLQLEKHTVPFALVLPLGESLWAVCDAGQTDDIRVLLPDAD